MEQIQWPMNSVKKQNESRVSLSEILLAGEPQIKTLNSYSVLLITTLFLQIASFLELGMVIRISEFGTASQH